MSKHIGDDIVIVTGKELDTCMRHLLDCCVKMTEEGLGFEAQLLAMMRIAAGTNKAHGASLEEFLEEITSVWKNCKGEADVKVMPDGSLG